MNLSQLYYFRTLTRVRSYKKAAAELYISEPTLSVAMKKLESELGCELLERKRNVIALTPEGEEFARCVDVSLSNLDAHVAAIKRRVRERDEVLRIGVVFSAQQRVWARLVSEFWVSQKREPNSIIRQGGTEQLLDALRHGDVDVIIVGDHVEEPGIESHPMWHTNVLAAINKENPLAMRESVTFEDIRRYHLISYAPESPVGEDTRKLAREHALEGDFSFSNEPSLCSNVAANPDTIALVCDSWLAYAFDKVAFVPIDDAPREFHRFWLAHLDRAAMGDGLLARFIRFATGYDFSSSKCDFVGPELNRL